MPKYWCRFLKQDNQVIRAGRVIALDDAAAIAEARRSAPNSATSFEIWRNVNFVHQEKLDIPQTLGRKDFQANPESIIGMALSGIARLSHR